MEKEVFVTGFARPLKGREEPQTRVYFVRPRRQRYGLRSLYLDIKFVVGTFAMITSELYRNWDDWPSRRG